MGTKHPTTKKCSKCGEVKPVEDFYLVYQDIPHWFRNPCRKCTVIASSAYRRRRREAMKRKMLGEE